MDQEADTDKTIPDKVFPLGYTIKNNKHLSEGTIIANCYVFLLAGYETTSTALAYTTWLLAKYPETQRKLQKEVDSVFPDKKQLETVTYDVLQKMEYLDAVFHEALRIFPPVIAFVVRNCVEETWLGNHRIPKDSQVMIPVWSVHHNPEIWPHPDVFDPERFAKGQTYHPMSWIPFGSGPRNCVGMRFATMEYKLALARLMRNFSVEFGPGSDIHSLPVKQTNILLRPDNGVRVGVVERELKAQR